MYKELGRPEYLYDTYEDTFKDDIYTPIMPKALIGHNRHATQGGVTVDTAHPFEYDNVIGAHNGTVWQHSMTSLNGHRQWNVDSQIIFQHINDTGSVQEVWDVADGAMALTWWDKQENTLKIARNNQRPLHWTISKDDKTLFWASQSWMLEVALSKAGVKHEKIHAFPIDSLFTISTGEKGKVNSEKEKLNPFVKKVAYTGYGAGYNYNYRKHDAKKSWVTLKEFVREGQKEYEGYFIALLEDDPTQEVVIDIDSVNSMFQEARYKRIVEFWRERAAIKQKAVYSFYEEEIDTFNGYWLLKEWHLTKSYGGLPAKTVEGNVVNINGKMLDKKQFEFKYQEGCCLCGTCVPFKDVKESLFIKDELICKECKEEDMVKEWLALEKEGKVA